MSDFKKVLKQLNSSNEDKRNQAKKIIKDFSNDLTRLEERSNNELRMFDDVTREDAKARLEKVTDLMPFSSLYQAIEKTYPDDSEAWLTATRYILLTILWYVNDDRTVDFISSIYSALPKNDDIRTSALQILSRINTEESLRLLSQLLNDYKTDSGFHALSIFTPLWTHTENVRFLLPDIIKVLNDKKLREPVYTTLQFARRHKDIELSDFAGNDLSFVRQTLISDLKKEHRRNLSLSKKGDSYRDSCELIGLILDFLGAFRGDSEITNLITSYLADSDSSVIMNAALALLSKGEKVERKVLYRVAADPVTRIELYEGLERLGQAHLFPEEFYTQEHFAEATMINWLSSGMEMGKPPDKIRLLTTREIEGDGNAERIFVYKFCYQNKPDVWMVGQSGPQPIDSSQVGTESYLTFSNFEKLDEKTIDEHVESILEYLESIGGDK